MGIKKIRVIDQRGQEKYLMPHIANNAKLMKSYRLTIQDPAISVEDEEEALLIQLEKEEKELKEKQKNKK